MSLCQMWTYFQIYTPWNASFCWKQMYTKNDKRMLWSCYITYRHSTPMMITTMTKMRKPTPAMAMPMRVVVAISGTFCSCARLTSKMVNPAWSNVPSDTPFYTRQIWTQDLCHKDICCHLILCLHWWSLLTCNYSRQVNVQLLTLPQLLFRRSLWWWLKIPFGCNWWPRDLHRHSQKRQEQWHHLSQRKHLAYNKSKNILQHNPQINSRKLSK